jgi:hypothetical protein
MNSISLRKASVALWLAVLLAASLACGGRLRERTETPPAQTGSVTAQPAQPGTAVSAPTEAPALPTAAPPATDTQPPPTATDTAAPTATVAPTETPAPQVDAQGDQLENLLGQLDTTNTAAQSDLDQIPQNP